MKEGPILMKCEMIQATLAGLKTDPAVEWAQGYK